MGILDTVTLISFIGLFFVIAITCGIIGWMTVKVLKSEPVKN